MKITRIILLTGLAAVVFTYSPAQSIEDLDQKVQDLEKSVNHVKPGKSSFMIRGYAHAGLNYEEAAEDLSFVGGSFNPLFIYRQSEKLLFESELEFHLEGDALDIGLEYANITYMVTPTLNLRAGKFLIPYGIFMDRMHPAWINKFPIFPLGFGHDALLPSTDMGVGAGGAFYSGPVKFNYGIFIANGPQLDDETGQLTYDQFPDNNYAKTFGGRLGFFPISNSSLELGISANYGKVGDRGSEYSDVAALLYAFDLTYVKALPSLKSVLDIKGQASFVNVDDAAYPIPTDATGALFYDFDNKSNAWFAQFSLRPSFFTSKIIRNMELNARYSEMETPSGASWEMDESQWDVGINYWLDWRTVIKFTYRIGPGEILGGHGGEGHSEEPDSQAGTGNAIFIHWAIGF